MGYTVTNGSTTLGEQFSKEIAGQAVNIIEIIAQGNSPIIQQENMANRFFDQFIKTVEAVPGNRVPIETWNITFSPAGLQSDAPEFSVKRAHFNLKKESFKVLGFNHSFDDVMSAKNAGIDLLAEDAEKVKRIKGLYMNTYLPTMKIQTIISGDSSSTTLPVANVGGKYSDQIGILRGEDCSDILQAHVVNKNVNMLRCMRSTNISSDDIFDTVQKLKDFRTNVGGEIIGVGSPRSIWELKNTLNAPENKDAFQIGGVPLSEIASVNYAVIDGLPDGFLFFLVKKAGEEMIIRAVEKDAGQQGLVMIGLNGLSMIKEASDLDGAYLQISKEGYHLLRREQIAILDITNGHSSGEMQTAGITALETFLRAVRGSVIGEY